MTRQRAAHRAASTPGELTWAFAALVAIAVLVGAPDDRGAGAFVPRRRGR